MTPEFYKALQEVNDDGQTIIDTNEIPKIFRRSKDWDEFLYLNKKEKVRVKQVRKEFDFSVKIKKGRLTRQTPFVYKFDESE